MRIVVPVMEVRARMFEPVKVREQREESLMAGGVFLSSAVARLMAGSQKIILPQWWEMGQLKSFTMEPPATDPKHAIVLVHGLQGKAEDLDYLQKVLFQSAKENKLNLMIHATAVNWRRTTDGVRAGGERVADDIREFVRKHPGLEEISVVGFSLGGIYARYAIATLFDAERKTVAGLEPRSFITVASPNLGVRNFGVFRFFNRNFQATLSKMVAGNTGVEMFLTDTGLTGRKPLLYEMSEDQEGLKFVSALGAFRRRVLYGNVQNDVMVPFGTAVLDPKMVELKNDYRPPEHAEIIDDAKDHMGCRVWFRSPPQEVTLTEPVADERSYEEVISHRLRKLGWETVGIQFDQLLPVAHNLIISKMRHELEWLLFTHCGQRSVHHIAETILDDTTSEADRQ